LKKKFPGIQYIDIIWGYYQVKSNNWLEYQQKSNNRIAKHIEQKFWQILISICRIDSAH
jgi:hypothetical protein